MGLTEAETKVLAMMESTAVPVCTVGSVAACLYSIDRSGPSERTEAREVLDSLVAKGHVRVVDGGWRADR